MDMVDFGSPLLQVLSAPAVVVLVVLAVLTMRAVRLRDRAMLFGRAIGSRRRVDPPTSSAGAGIAERLTAAGSPRRLRRPLRGYAAPASGAEGLLVSADAADDRGGRRSLGGLRPTPQSGGLLPTTVGSWVLPQPRRPRNLGCLRASLTAALSVLSATGSVAATAFSAGGSATWFDSTATSSAGGSSASAGVTTGASTAAGGSAAAAAATSVATAGCQPRSWGHCARSQRRRSCATPPPGARGRQQLHQRKVSDGMK